MPWLTADALTLDREGMRLLRKVLGPVPPGDGGSSLWGGAATIDRVALAGHAVPATPATGGPAEAGVTAGQRTRPEEPIKRLA